MDHVRGRLLDYHSDPYRRGGSSSRREAHGSLLSAAHLRAAPAPSSSGSLPPSSMPSLSSGHSYYTVESLQGASALPSAQFSLPPARSLPADSYALGASERGLLDRFDSRPRILQESLSIAAAVERAAATEHAVYVAAAERANAAAVERAAVAVAAERAALERSAAEQGALERATAERAALERAALERATAERAALERAAGERAALGRVAAERAAVERAASERAAFERAAGERAALGRAAAERAAVERAASERAAFQRATVERAAALERGVLERRGAFLAGERVPGLPPPDRLLPRRDSLHQLSGYDHFLGSVARGRDASGPPLVQDLRLAASRRDALLDGRRDYRAAVDIEQRRAGIRRDAGAANGAATNFQKPTIIKRSEALKGGHRGTAEERQGAGESVYCSLCKVDCVNMNNLRNHLTGKKHKQQLEIAKGGIPEVKPDGDKKTDNEDKTDGENKLKAGKTSDDWKAISGKKEVEKVDGKKKVGKVDVVKEVDKADRNKKDAQENKVDSSAGVVMDSTGVVGKKRAKPDKGEATVANKRVKVEEPSATASNIVDSEGKGSSHVFCDLCKIRCTSQKNLEMHLEGKRHVANLKGQPS